MYNDTTIAITEGADQAWQYAKTTYEDLTQPKKQEQVKVKEIEKVVEIEKEKVVVVT